MKRIKIFAKLKNMVWLKDEDYKFIFERVPRLCLDFVTVKNGKILLSKREIEPFKGFWHLPGGMVRYKESINEAVNRILIAEIGLKSISKELIGYIEFPDEINQNGIHIHSISIVFFVKLEEGKIRGSSQAQEVNFFDNLPDNMVPSQKFFLRENWDNIIKV